MKKLIASSVLTTAVLFPALVNAEEIHFPASYVSGKTTEIHKGATSSYPIVSSLTLGQKVNVIDKFTNTAGETWYRIEKGGTKGWVISSSLQEVTPPPVQTPPPALPSKTKPSLPAIGSYLYSQVNGLEARRGATPAYAVVGALSLNQKVQVTDQFTSATGDAWLKVQFAPTISGWVPASSMDNFQSIHLSLIVTADSANLRGGPTMQDTTIRTAPKGTILNAVGFNQDPDGDIWYKIAAADGTFSWVHQSVVKKQEAFVSTKYVATKNTLLYSGATTNYAVKLKLPYFSKLTIIGEFTNSLNQTWTNVKTSTGVTGWVPKNELVTSKSDIQYTHAFNSAVVRSGATANYPVKAFLKENESVVVLGELNGWLNVETSSGIRGWIDKSYTSPVSMKRLIAPYTEVVNGDQYLNWKKAYNFGVSYSVLSGNRLKISGAFTDVELLNDAIPGIKSIEAVPSAGGTEKSLVVTFEEGYTFTLRNSSGKVSIKIIATGLAGKKIIIDPGHGGKDTGAIGPSGYFEKTANLATALALKTELEKYGAIVTMTRSTDVFVELSGRTYIANSSDYDAFISLHSDSFKTTSNGSTTYYNTSVNFNGPRSKGMADAIQHQLIASIGTTNRGVLEQDFYVNRMNELPSILVELAYISNPAEEKLLRSPDFRQKAAIGIRKGLEDYFGKF